MDTLANILNLIFGSFASLSVVALSSFAIILIFKTSSTTNFAQGMVSTFGAFFTAYLITVAGLPMWLGVIIGIVTGFVLGIIVDFGIIRRAKIVTPVGKQMITMGIVLILLAVIPMIFVPADLPLGTSIPRLSETNLRFNMGSTVVILGVHDLLSLIIATVFVGGMFLTLKYTRWGLAVRATASNERVAGMMGINTRMITALSWGIAGAIGSLAAMLLAAKMTSLTSTEVGIMGPIQIQGFLATVLGGFSTFHGPIVGALIIGLARPLISSIPALSEWAPFIVYGIVLVAILIKPLGLFGKKVTKKV